MTTDTLKLGKDEPRTREQPRVAATLIVDYAHRQSGAFAPQHQAVVGTTLKPVWVVDFYRGRPGGR